MQRGYHQRSSHGQRGSYGHQNVEGEPRNSFYYGGYYLPTAGSAGGEGGGAYAAGYFTPAATPAAASGHMPRDMQYHLPQPRSLQGFTPHPYGRPYGLHGAHSSAVYQFPRQEEEERLSDSSDEYETKDPNSVRRDRKAGPRKSLPIPSMEEKEARNFPPSLHSEFTSTSAHLPPMGSETLRVKAEKAAKAAYERLLTEKKGVTVWKIIQEMLMQLGWNSLEASGLSIHDIPSLQKLVILEGKVNSYIHCHVAVRRITTLHELSQEISRNEGVQDFNDLKLGPISFHPLVSQYFAFPGGLEVCKISTEDVLNHLSAYMNKHTSSIQVDDFLSFMSKTRSLSSPLHLGVRLQSFG